MKELKLFEKEARLEVGDLLELKEKTLIFSKGERFKVEKIEDDTITVSSKLGLGIMNSDELNKFNIVKKNSEWSEWVNINVYSKTRYKIKGSKIVVKQIMAGKTYRGYANCSEEDEYDLEKGIKIALERIKIEFYKNNLKKLIN